MFLGKRTITDKHVAAGSQCMSRVTWSGRMGLTENPEVAAEVEQVGSKSAPIDLFLARQRVG